MKTCQMGAVEARFAELIWAHEPITAAELAQRSRELLGWKKSTAYTVLKRLCGKGIFRNDSGVVTSVLSRQAFYGARSEQFVAETFDGSLPAFLAAFTARRGLTAEEAEHLRQMAAAYEEGQ